MELTHWLPEKFRLAKNETEYPPDPDDLFTRSEDDDEIISGGLRELEGDTYIGFLQDFGKAVYGKTFHSNANARPLKGFFPTCMEAFLLVAYDNGYARWKQEELQKKEGEALEEDSLPDYKYTACSKGARTCEGWTEEGVALYDELFDKLSEQRQNSVFGTEFDKKFMISIAAAKKCNGRGEHRNDLDDIALYEQV